MDTDLVKFKNDIIRKFAYLIRMINKELKKDIKRKNAIDTSLMYNQTRVKKLRFKVTSTIQRIDAAKGNELDVRDTINELILFTTFYYKFVDEGTRTIRPRRFTRDVFTRPFIVNIILETQLMLYEYSFLANMKGVSDETGITSR